MKFQKLNLLTIAMANLKGRTFRSLCLISLAAILSFTILTGLLLTNSLSEGMESMRQRLGADLMVVPEGNQTEIEGALLRGEPGTFYFKKQKIEKIISGTPGVQIASSQLFLASLSKGCCSFPVQLIGYDPVTDFVIAPWISDQLNGKLEDGELVVGSLVDAEPGGTLKFFEKTYRVEGKLEETGMGFDTSVFMNYHTEEAVLNSAKQLGISFQADGGDLVSAVMIREENGFASEDLGEQIMERLEAQGIQADIVIPQNILNSTTKSIEEYIRAIRVFSIMIWILACLLLTVIFTYSIQERKKEIAVLSILGATRIKLLKLIFGESLLICTAGALAGTLLTFLVIFPFNTLISIKLGMPYILPPPEKVALLTLISLLLTSLLGPAASVYSACRIGRRDIHTTMREGE